MSAEAPLESAITVRQGDGLLVALRRNDLTREQADHMRALLAERFPGVDVTVIGGVAALAVIPASTGGAS